MSDEKWLANLRIAQAVLDKLAREADPMRRPAYRSALSGVESELADAHEEGAEA